MLVQRAYKTELKLNNRERTLLAGCAGAARFAYNWGLRQKIDAYAATGKSPSYYELHRQLNQLKKSELAWLYGYSKTIPQEALRDLDRAFQNFFRRVKQGETPGFPRFKSRKRGLGSFRLWGSVHVAARRIKLPRIGWLRLKERNYLPTGGVKVLSATVSERAGRWYVSLQVEEEITERQATGAPVGVDLGLHALAVCSNGQTYANPRALNRATKKVARCQRELSRRQRGSRNRARTKAKLARLHQRVAHLRQNAIHQATASIVAKTKPDDKRPSVVMLEELNVVGMMQNHKLARAIGDAGLGEFSRQMRYKSAWYGITVQRADRWYPSSKRCSGCGEVKASLLLSERVYRCETCGLVMDRDLNAARNLVQLSEQTTARSAGSEACGEAALAAR
ncbi:MAG: transposase [Ardenticatenaceae bacterium]|nr:transposase [Ardenticatenaceae bacterium]